MRKQEITISVIGGHKANAEVEYKSTEIGKIIAKMGAILVCGGLHGTMVAACKGAKEAGGRTIGILPGSDKNDANPYIDIALPTSIGYSRNIIVACSADIIVAMPGSYGTQSEICYGLIYKRPVIDFGNWNIRGMIPARDITEVESVIKEHVQKLRGA